MGLFTSPLVINDGTADRTFTYRAQLSISDSTASEYIEAAADSSARSNLTVKHTVSKTGRPRHLLQRSQFLTINDADDTLDSIVINLTIASNSNHTDAQVAAQVALVAECLAEANFVANMRRNMI
jgi:hypothetical protein